MSADILPVRNNLLEQWGSDLLAVQALPGISRAVMACAAGGEMLPESIGAEFRLGESFDSFKGAPASYGQGVLMLAGVQMHGEHTEIAAGILTLSEDPDPAPHQAHLGKLRAYGNLLVKPSDCRSGRGRDPRLDIQLAYYESGHAFIWGDVETQASSNAILGDYGRLGNAWQALGLDSLESLPDAQRRSEDWNAPLRARIGSLTAPQQIGASQIDTFTEFVSKLHRGEDAVPDTFLGTIIMDEDALQRLKDSIQKLKEVQEDD